ncbi:S49 family peptidase [Marinomonas spartinae]|uniref:S49 family peptidase n=1 Tax=Marinomonas spartinae TaxID=1792290 RepID=UPI0018F2673B|nr:S49 family peptidase [Marinomonas spartinae]MBJ7555396.1 S49 family peptidase [Marinomonas spartinae]
MPTNLTNIEGRFLNSPLFLERAAARTFFSTLSKQLNIKQMLDEEGEVPLGEKIHLAASSFSVSREHERCYEVVDGVAVIPVYGTLINKLGFLKPFWGMTGYDGIVARCKFALSDVDVKGVLLDMNTHGGEVSGCFDAVETIKSMFAGSGKALWVIIDAMACSAGMAIASAAERRLITQSSKAGSVGVVMAHHSYGEYLKESGIEVTLIHSGSHKVEGNPYESLPKNVLADFQASTDKLRDEFATLVAVNMGLSKEAVLATEAAVYRGQEAIDIGFADQLVNGNEAIAIFADYLKKQSKTTLSGVTMSAQPNATQTAETQPESAPVATNPVTEPVATAPAVDEKARIEGILTSAEAKGREAQANHLAFKTSMSVEDAVSLLATAPIAAASPEAHGTKLDELMASHQNPVIETGPEGSAEVSEVDQIMAAYNMARGE